MKTGNVSRAGNRRLFRAALCAVVLAPPAVARDGEDPDEPPAELPLMIITGSRIRRVSFEGPSPVAAYDGEFIRATGALTLADFLRHLPENHSGIGVGRGSAPNELNPEFGQRTETTLPAFNFVLGAAAAPPGQTGVSGASLRGLGSGSTLILIDGRRAAMAGTGNQSTNTRQGFVDLNTIPFGMIERIETITDGGSAAYGTDAAAGAINIILRKDYTGAELISGYRVAERGGARERHVTLSGGFSRDRLRGTVAVSLYDRASLKASRRSFSADQDHLDRDGRDLRLNWGYPAVVQVRFAAEDLNGVTDASGNPVKTALVPEGASGPPAPFDFEPGASNFAAGQRRGNTAAFIDLIPSSDRWAVDGSFTYAARERIDLYGRYTHSDVSGLFATQPPVSSASASTGFGSFATIVPASIDGEPNALNPFGQDVLVGFYHHEFGSVTQATRTESHRALLGLRGFFLDSWKWDGATSWSRQSSTRATRDFDGPAFTAALAAPDPARRFNPFIDARAAGPVHAALYEDMTILRTVDAVSTLHTLDLVADGTMGAMPGGEARLAVGGEINRFGNRSISNVPASEARGRKTAYAGYAEGAFPLYGTPNARAGIQRLEIQAAGRFENQGDAGDKIVTRLGLLWAPAHWLLIRSSRSTGFRAPFLTEYQVAAHSGAATVTDPLRTPNRTPGVQTLRGSNPGIRPEAATNRLHGFILEPGFVPGLSAEVNYYRTQQNDVIQMLTPQTIVDNESVFSDRVTRAPPDAADRALGQPGSILSVDTTFLNFGSVRNESADFRLNWRNAGDAVGRVNIHLSASRTIKAARSLAPALADVDDTGDTLAPPKWKSAGTVIWSKGIWSAAAFVHHIGAFESNRGGNPLVSTERYPSHTTADLRVGREFPNGILGGVPGSRIRLGVANVFDARPPFSDTVFGYNGALHAAAGRTFEVSINVPLK